MKIEIHPDADTVASQGARFLGAEIQNAVAARGRCVVAVSGGHTPWEMLKVLAGLDLPWAGVHIIQVDERVAPPGDPDRNLTHLRASLLSQAPLRADQIYAMPVEEPDLNTAAKQYEQGLDNLVGSPPVLDVVHLGLGPDGHTASLVPGDSVLDVTDADVAATGVYQGRRRLTLTYPILNRARRILWLVTGESKVEMLLRLRDGDRTIPAGRVRQEQATILADRAAAARIG
jgi:6-phosphogluconolactonase